MDDGILDNDGLIKDVTFKRFLKERSLHVYIILNILFLIFCIIYIINPGDLQTVFCLVSIYFLNNLWLFLAYIDWKRKVCDVKN